MKNNDIEKKPIGTKINAELLYKFKVYCVVNKLRQNQILEKLIREEISKGKQIDDKILSTNETSEELKTQCIENEIKGKKETETIDETSGNDIPDCYK